MHDERDKGNGHAKFSRTDEKVVQEKDRKIFIKSAARDASVPEETLLADVKAFLGKLGRADQHAAPKPSNGQVVIQCVEAFSDYIVASHESGTLTDVFKYPVAVSVQQIKRLLYPKEICVKFVQFFRFKTYHNQLNQEVYLDLSSFAETCPTWAEVQAQNKSRYRSPENKEAGGPSAPFNDLHFVNALVDYLCEAQITVLILANNGITSLGALTCPTGLKNAKTMAKLVLSDNQLATSDELHRLTFIKQLKAVVLTGNPITKDANFTDIRSRFTFDCIIQYPLPRQLPEYRSYSLLNKVMQILHRAVKNGDSSMLLSMYTLDLDNFGISPASISPINHIVHFGGKSVAIACPADNYLSSMCTMLDGKIMFPDSRAKLVSSATSVVLNPYCTVPFGRGMPNLIRTVCICTGSAILRQRKDDAEEAPYTYYRTMTFLTPCLWNGDLRSTLAAIPQDPLSTRIVADVAQFHPL